MTNTDKFANTFIALVKGYIRNKKNAFIKETKHYITFSNIIRC